MSLDMYNFIKENEDRLKYDLEKGLVITPKNTNGTICTSTGYLRVKVNKKALQVHQIMAVKYFGDKCIGMQINHKDGNKLNNLKTNLDLVTREENIKHGWNNGLYNNSKKTGFYNLLGSKHPNSKLTEEQARYIKYSDKKTKELSDMFNVDPRTIRYVRGGVGWRHI